MLLLTRRICLLGAALAMLSPWPCGESAAVNLNFLAREADSAAQIRTHERSRRYVIDNHIPDIDSIEYEVSQRLPVIHSLHVESNIRYRFANTLVTSRMANKLNESRQATFAMELPEAAFITNFTLHLDDRVIVGEVKEKQEAKDIYDAAVSRGETAAHISAKPRETNRFTIAVNMAAHTELTFELTYQEFLQRKFSSYSHVINIKPGQVVRDMKVDVAIVESRRLTAVRVPPISRDIATEHWRANEIEEEQDFVEITYGADGQSAFVEFHPDPTHQIVITNATDGDELERGIQGQFAVYYDVERTADVGEVYMYNGYFVHFFAPTDLEVVDKHVLFVLDVSGSMSGTKISQLKDAMEIILSDLKEGDSFNIVIFSSSVSMWKNESVSVNGDSILEAKRFVQSLRAQGGTNINQAVLDAITFLSSQEESLVNIVIFLTDGEATSGETSRPAILENVRRANSETSYPIYSLAFGRGADYDFVRKMSFQNTAIARKIYEDSDAALQLKGFYDEISSPLLANVKVTYLNDTVERETVVQDKKHKDFFEGCEIVICGRIKPTPLPMPVRRTDELLVATGGEGPLDEGEKAEKAAGEPYFLGVETNDVVIPYVSGEGAEGSVVYTDVIVDEESEQAAVNLLAAGIENMWAYLTVKDLINKEIELDDAEEKAAVREKALQLSLEYNLVTSLTSMVVTLPDENKPPTVLRDAESGGEEDEDVMILSSGPLPAAPQPGGGYYGRPMQMSAGLPGPSGPAGQPGHRRTSHGIKHAGGRGLNYPLPPPRIGLPNSPYYPTRGTTSTTTTTTTSTTTPAPPAGLDICRDVNELPNDRYRIFYDSFADYDVSGYTSDGSTGPVYLTSIAVSSRSLSFRIQVSYPDIAFAHGTVGWHPAEFSYYHVEVKVSEYEVVIRITDTLNAVSEVRITRGLVPYTTDHYCLNYSITTP